MTREEREQAITQLKILKEDYWDDDGYGHETREYEDTMQALDAAIDALEWLNRPCVVNASEIKQDDEWMQENEWDEVYKDEDITPSVSFDEVEKSFIEDVEKVKDLLPCGDTISRQDVIDTINSLVSTMSVCINKDELQGMINMKERAIDAVKTIQPVYPARKTGKWIDENGNEVPFLKGTTVPSHSCWCSNCKEWLVASDEYAVEGAFCPKCGADMKGE